MKRLIALSAATLAAFQAHAADLPARVAPPIAVPVPYTWTGFYIGAHMGYLDQTGVARNVGSNVFDSSGLNAAVLYANGEAAAITGPLTKPRSFMGGGQIGYNYQVGSVVFGIEADISALPETHRTTATSFAIPGFVDVVTTTVNSRAQYDYFGTVRGRLGFLATENLLLYGTGGFAYADLHRSLVINNTINVGPPQTFVVSPFGGSFRANRMVTGYTIGGGLEYALSKNWSFKAEALYYDLGKSTLNGQFSSFSQFFNPPVVFTTNGVRATNDSKGYLARVGLNYKFNLF